MGNFSHHLHASVARVQQFRSRIPGSQYGVGLPKGSWKILKDQFDDLKGLACDPELNDLEALLDFLQVSLMVYCYLHDYPNERHYVQVTVGVDEVIARGFADAEDFVMDEKDDLRVCLCHYGDTFVKMIRAYST